MKQDYVTKRCCRKLTAVPKTQNQALSLSNPFCPGLCFNQNIRWTKALRDKWKVGFDDPYNGYLTGVGNSPIEYDNAESLKALLPLNIGEEVYAADRAYMNQAHRWGHLEEFTDSQFSEKAIKMEQEYLIEERHTFFEFENLFLQNSSLFLCSRSIWYNTLYYEISETEVFTLLRLKRYANLG